MRAVTSDSADLGVMMATPSSSSTSSSSASRLYSVALAMSGFWTHLLIHGVMYTPGVFYVIFLEELHYDSAPQVALGTSLHSAVLYGSGPICSVLINSFGCRVVGVVGGFISGAGLVLTIFSRNVYYMAVMFGIVTGFGMGMTYVASTVMISRHFTTYRSTAIAIANSAIGIGTIVYPPLLRALEEYYGWKGALLIIGAISLNLVVCASFYREPKIRRERMKRDDQDMHQSNPSLVTDGDKYEPRVDRRKKVHACCSIMQTVFGDIKVFRNRGYVMLCISTVFICTGLSVLYVHLAAFMQSRGIDINKSAMLVSMIGVGNFLGQILTGLLHQLTRCTGFMSLFAGFTNVGIMMLLLTVVHHYALAMALATAIGMGCGCFGTSLLDVIVRALGVERVNAGFGYLLVFMASGHGIGGPIAGIIYEASGRYISSLYFGGCLLVTGASLMLPDIIMGCRNKNYYSEERVEIGTSDEEQL